MRVEIENYWGHTRTDPPHRVDWVDIQYRDLDEKQDVPLSRTLRIDTETLAHILTTNPQWVRDYTRRKK